jgi:dipeptidyl aminopeptidase/acylaminoacyl peptidase
MMRRTIGEKGISRGGEETPLPLLARLVLTLVILGLPGSALAATAVIALDGLATTTAAGFDRVQAAPEEGFRLTSIENDAVIPANHAYPLIEWSAPEVLRGPYLLNVRSGDLGLEVVMKGRSWQPAKAEFAPFLKRKEILVTVFARDGAASRRSATVRLLVDERPLKDKIAFRVVQPLFSPALPNSLKALSFGSSALSTLMEFPSTCVGCHGYAGSSAIFNVKRGPRRQLVTTSREKKGHRLGNRSLGEFSFFSISPDGLSTAIVRAPAGKLTIKQTSEEPFDYPYQSADISYFTPSMENPAPLPGASDPAWVEDMPFFSPDGASVLFSRYRSETRDGIEGIFAMEIYKVPFDGGKGGEATPVVQATPEAPWNYFPRCSPDGRWISFTRGDATLGVYARKSSDIWLMPAAGGEPRRLLLNREGGMDSWHSWSPDSRWLAFASKREEGGMTALYLSRIGDDGTDSPPIKLAGFPGMKINTPQFVPDGLGVEKLTGASAFVESLYQSK